MIRTYLNKKGSISIEWIVVVVVVIAIAVNIMPDMTNKITAKGNNAITRIDSIDTLIRP